MTDGSRTNTSAAASAVAPAGSQPVRTVLLRNVALWGCWRRENPDLPSVVDVIAPIADSAIVEPGCSLDAAHAPADAPLEIDCTGTVLVPGFADPHVHFRDPGQTAKETMVTGCAAAVSGGYTSVLIMPNTVPALDGARIDPADPRAKELHGYASSIDYLEHYEQANGVTLPVRYALCAAASRDREGGVASSLDDWRHALAATGEPGFAHPVIAVSDDGAAVPDALLDAVARMCLEADVPFIDHCEHHDAGVMNEGAVSRRLGVPGIPEATETTIIARDIELARRTGCHVHLQHVSCAASFDLIRRAKDDGLPVTCETAPHYLALDDTAVERLGTMAKMNPPLRSEENKLATRKAVADGTVDLIATDHAPHTAEEKAQGLLKAPNGIIGLEAAYGVCRDVLVNGGYISSDRLVQLMSVGPSLVMHNPVSAVAPADLTAPAQPGGKPVLDLTRLATGSDASSAFHYLRGGTDYAAGAACDANPRDYTLINMHREWTVDPAQFRSKARNTPYAGMRLTGRPVATLVGGRIVFSRI
ncbi:MAG: dihydroorotase [Bifidobacteriaceae bacterium]|nr:dihydroorotase [Bifidobacteriaceae bacterium]